MRGGISSWLKRGAGRRNREQREGQTKRIVRAQLCPEMNTSHSHGDRMSPGDVCATQRPERGKTRQGHGRRGD